jgi:hypothetical protein
MIKIRILIIDPSAIEDLDDGMAGGTASVNKPMPKPFVVSNGGEAVSIWLGVDDAIALHAELGRALSQLPPRS